MSTEISAEATARVLRAIADRTGRMTRRRMLVALAGAPGSGKSTFAEALASAMARQTSRTAAVVAQDGFHLDNRVLDACGLRDRKGAPETFDGDGLDSLLMRLRRATADVAVPIFDRGLDMVRGSAQIVPAAAEIVVVEGNYLLLDAPPWSRMRRRFDLCVMLTCPLEALRSRLEARWIAYGLTPEAATARAESNDLRNAHLVMSRSTPADLVVAND